ncbi:MAG TPA: DUF2339 domain-containing protein [Gemmataceae bacterium]|nr:DUF2339 domain-containing protein [Gemmataceae bacterium]
MLDALVAVVAGLCMLAVAVALLALPVIALLQTAQLKDRLRELEREVNHLRLEKSTPNDSIEGEEAPATEQAPPREHRRQHKPHPRPRSPDWTKLESWLGVRLLGWAAVILLLFTAAFFLKVLFDRGLIGELGRIMIGIGVGSGLAVLGWVCHRRGQWIFSQMLTSGGIIILYLSMYATFGFYDLLPQTRAAPFLMILVAEALLLAALYQAPAIAIMAVVGGLLNPILLHTERDQYVGLFSYLVILNAGVVVLSLFRRWWIVTTLAIAGTHGLFWLWYFERYHPGKLDACVAFHLALFALYLGQTIFVNAWRRTRINVEEAIRLLLVAGAAANAGYWLLDDRYHLWMGTFAVGMAIVYALQAWLVSRLHAPDETLLFLSLAVSMAFLAAVFPLQADAAWIAVGWAAQGLALWWFGLRVHSTFLYALGAAFLALALGRLLLVDTLTGSPHIDPFIPILNRYGLPAVLVAFSLIAAALLQRHTHPAPDTPEFVIMRLIGLSGVVALWIVLSIETYDFFVVRSNLASPVVLSNLTLEERELPRAVLQDRFAQWDADLRLTAQMSLSVLWAIIALVLVAFGLRLQHRPLRWLGLGLFALTLGKVMLVDTDRLHGMYRVGAFFALSLMMGAGAWTYQRLRHVMAPVAAEDEHESAA